MIAECRQHNRIDVHWRARILKKGAGMVRGVVANVSLGGVMVRCALPLATRDLILLEFEADRTPPVRLICECEVVRCIPDPTTNEPCYGLRFHRIKDEDIGTLLGLIAERWTAPGP